MYLYRISLWPIVVDSVPEQNFVFIVVAEDFHGAETLAAKVANGLAKVAEIKELGPALDGKSYFLAMEPAHFGEYL